METPGDDLLLVEGGGLEVHVHEVIVHAGVAADLGVGGVVEGLDVLLEGGAQEVDVFDHPVVGNAFPDVFLLGFEVGGQCPEADTIQTILHPSKPLVKLSTTGAFRN